MRENVLDLVTSLVEKSLVMVEQEGDGSRYGLLETIREFAYERLTKRYGILETIRDFARERLTDRGDVAATAARHCNYYLGIAKTARGKLEGPEQAAWMRRLEVDLDNLRASIALALAVSASGRARGGLSAREREIAVLVGQGLSSRSIADMLHLSVRTVETHRAHIQQKLRLGSRSELVRYALEHRLIEAE